MEAAEDSGYTFAMRTVRVIDAQRDLPELIDSAADGEEIIITRDDRPVAKLIRSAPSVSLRDIKPTSVGAILRPLSTDDDLLDEMLAH
jgi:prevent-host-death family protein